IYRHFGSKEEMLVALYDRTLDELLAGARRAAKHARPVDELIDRHAAFAVRERGLIRIWARESQNLPEDDRRRLRRKQRVYTDVWTDAVLRARPDLSRASAATLVHAVFGLLNSVADYASGLPRDELQMSLREAAQRVLRV